MTIKKRLATTIGLLVAFTVLIIVSLLLSMVQVRRAVEKGRMAARITRGTDQLGALASGYALHRTKREKRQWEEQHDSLSTVLRQASALSSDAPLFERLATDQSSMERIFWDLAARYEATDVPEYLRELRKESEERLVTQLLAKAEDMQYEVYVLGRRSAEDIGDAQARAFFSILALMLLLLGTLAFLSARFYRGVVYPLKDLEDASEQIAKGNLDHEAAETEDEVGHLARVFNGMRRSLKESYTELSREVAERRQAQWALQEAHDDLERQVIERTKDLAAANRDLLERTGQLEETNKELEGFAYTISHDLRTPLRAIDGFVRILERDHGQKLDSDARHKFDVVRSNAQKMGQLIDDLLSFSRLGRTEMRRTGVDMTGLAKETLREIAAADPEGAAAVRIGDLPAAHGDPVLLRQVFANLMENAVKFSRGRQGPLIEVGAFDKDGEPVYYVKDNGAGFDMRYYDKLFGVFQRLHSDSQFKGTGVGLAIVQRIVRRHNGRVWAEGAVGEGATFYFTISGRSADER